MSTAAPLWISHERLLGLISVTALVPVLREGFLRGAETAPRQFHKVGEDHAAVLQMLAWADGIGRVVKVMSAVPSNAARGLPTSSEVLNFFHPVTGRLMAVIECVALTNMRTAAASALASQALAREDAAHLTLIGTGPLAPWLAIAHAGVRPLTEITICGRDLARAERTASAVQRALPALCVRASTDLATAVAAADIVSTATRATEPVLRGAWLKPGAHIDLVGGYTPQMREADDAVMQGAEIWLDQREAGLTEPGDIVTPLENGTIGRQNIQGDLFDLVRMHGPARRSAQSRTVFKSIGCALEDLYAARAVVEAALGQDAFSI